ncbi:type II toxin-antitoxin system HicA family toxin [Flavobacterium sp. JP2137]|uniref:type II toxin-antitoxin system HicA family toxin n=1 Tax=Flavobacterium sp. JP2137 TaxID=3414510 RepID=UPI003D2FA4E3
MVSEKSSTAWIKILEKAGWVLYRTKGSHRVFKHRDFEGLITVPHPRKDVPKGLFYAILKQAGIT